MKTPGLYWHESEGNIKIKLKKKSLFFLQFSKNGSGGSVKRKIKKKLWPYKAVCLDLSVAKGHSTFFQLGHLI